MSAAGQATAVTGDQFFVTHCATADSVLGSPGYSIRAASVPRTADDIRLALEYPTYELPLEMWPHKPAKANTPRRLARTKHPESGVWIAHSVYLEKDTMNRDRSYFTHLVHLPASVDAAVVLRSWDAPGWAVASAPGATQKLARTKLPAGTAISDDALASFLSEAQTGPADVAVAVCPTRLHTNTAGRRELVARFLQAMVLTIDAHDGRDRLYVHAEPGLVAMLLYAAVRILPPSWTADLTFSTFEPHHKGLRDYKLATVVGTYFGVANKALGTDLTTIRGYGLDAISPERSSPELRVPLPPGLMALIDVAAAGDWGLLAEVHRWVGTEGDVLAEVGKLIPVARALRELEGGTPTIDDLIALQSDARGADAIAQAEEKLWPIVRGAARVDPRVRHVFAHWLTRGDRLDQFRRAAIQSLREDDLAGWDSWWAVVRDAGSPELVKQQAEKTLKYASYLPSIESRSRLRAACAAAGVWPDHHLLAPISPAELDVLLAPLTPADWQGYSCVAVMGPDEKNWLTEPTGPFRSVMREQVRRYLWSASAAVLAAYAEHARPLIAEIPGLLDDLLQPPDPVCVEFLGRLIDVAASRIEAIDWVNLLSRQDIYGVRTSVWAGFLLRDDHLAKLLTGFKADPAATAIWGSYLALLSPEVFDGDEWETMLFGQLRKAKQALTGAGIPLRAVLPEGGPARLNAADTILEVYADPGSAESLPMGELPKAFEAFGMAPVEGLRKLYIQRDYHLLELPADRPKLGPFVAAFLACYPVTHEYYSSRTAVTQWLAISESCDEHNRAQFQLLFIREFVPENFHRDILEESRQVPIMPEVVARVFEGLTGATKKAVEHHVPVPVPVVDEDVEVFAESRATKRARRSKRTPGGRRAERGMPSWVIALLVMLVIGVTVALIAVLN